MRKFFLPVAAILALVGGANAQSPAKKPVAGGLYEPDAPALPPVARPLGLGKGSSVLKGLDVSPFGKPAAQPAFPLPKLSMPEVFDPDTRPVGPGTAILRKSDPFRDLGKSLETVRPMDKAKFPAEWKLVHGLKAGFPRLGDDFEVQGPSTTPFLVAARKAGLLMEVPADKPGDDPTLVVLAGDCVPGTYNCIAHTVGIKSVWVNPYRTAAGWDMYYKPHGYTPAAGTDTSPVSGVQKVAVYATKRPDGRLSYTHAAVQEADGTWTSKLGSAPLIRHRTAESVGGGTYGEVVRVYTRPRPQ